jgi:hypothetical protein
MIMDEGHDAVPAGEGGLGNPDHDPAVRQAGDRHPDDSQHVHRDPGQRPDWVPDRVPEEWEIEGPAVSISLGDAADVDPALLTAMTGPDGLGGDALCRALEQDRAADVLRPGPVLCALAEQAAGDLPRLSDEQLMGALSAARRLENRAAYLGVLAVAEFARRREAQAAQARAARLRSGLSSGDFPDTELAIELLVTQGEAGHLLGAAASLTARLPGTLAGMAAGSIDYARAATIVGYTDFLGDADAAFADAVLAAAAPGLRPDRLARKAAALEMKLDPEAARTRKERAKQDRRVEVRRERSGNASIAGRELATADVLASKANLDAIAARLRRAGADGTLDSLRAWAMTELLQGRNPLSGIAPAPRDAANAGETHAGETHAGEAHAGEAHSGGTHSGGTHSGGTHSGGEPADGAPADGAHTNDGPADGGSADGAHTNDGHTNHAFNGPADGGSADDAQAGDVRADSAGSVGTRPGQAQPDGAGRVGTEPIGTEPIGTEPGDTESGDAEPDGTEPGTAGPGSSRAGTYAAGPASASASAFGAEGHAAGRCPGTPPAPDSRPAAPFPATLNVTVPVGTLLGWSSAPATAGTWGLLDPDDTRDIVAAASRHPATRWGIIFTGPDGTAVAYARARGQHRWTPPPGPGPQPGPASPPPGGRASAGPTPEQAARLREFLRALNLTPEPIARGDCDHRHAEDRYSPSRALQDLVRARSATCTAPGCGAQAAHCDLDHATPYPGGTTCQCNLHPLCRRHHRAKQAPGWHADQPQPGTVRWTTPSRRTHTTTPTSYDS